MDGQGANQVIVMAKKELEEQGNQGNMDGEKREEVLGHEEEADEKIDEADESRSHAGKPWVDMVYRGEAATHIKECKHIYKLSTDN